MTTVTSTASLLWEPLWSRVRAPESTLALSRGRRMTLFDAMVLVGATAIGFAWARGMFPPGHRYHWLIRSYVIAPPLFACWTVALLALRLQRPRDDRAALLRQPGTVGLAAAAAMLALAAFQLAILGGLRLWQTAVTAQATRLVTTKFPPVSPRLPSQLDALWCAPFYELAPTIGPAVLGAWLLLALSGQRRAERGWIDPLARLIGLGWVALWAVRCWITLYQMRK